MDEPGPHVRGAQGVQIGSGNVQTNFFDSTVTVLAPVPVTWPVQVGVIPSAAGSYQDRIETGQLTGSGSAVATHILSGLGGVGKTQLTAAYARSCTDLDLRVWITASSREAVLAGYAETAAQLGYPVQGDAEQAARWTLTWLQKQSERSWLIVLDDLTDPADLRGLWPTGPRGHTVVTTRRTDAALTTPTRGRINVGLFTPDQAITYLAERLTTTPDDARMQEAAELAAELGHLPLALAQAAAFILDRGDSCARYRARLADRRRRLADLFPPDALADEYPAALGATWSISLDAADALTPPGLARPVLELLSVLDPNGIPAHLLATAPATTYAAGRTSAGASVQDMSDALHNLARLSLATLDPTGGSTVVRVHGLVQRATLDNHPPEELDQLHPAVADALLEIWPEIERDTELGQVLRSNARTLAAQAGASLWAGYGHPLLRRAGMSLVERGLVRAAIVYWEQMVSDSGRHLGRDHPDTLFARHALAHARGEAGDPRAAAADYEQLLTDRLRLLGPDHHDTLATRNNLAQARGEAGDARAAAAAFAQILADHLRVRGPDHPATLTARNNLAIWRGEAGEAHAAVTLLEQLLADRIRVLGPDHVDTLATRYNLAHWRARSSNPEAAISAYEELVADYTRVLGPDHPQTLITRHNLARWWGEAGDASTAASATEELLADYLRLLGPDHPHTLITRHNLARWRGEMGEPRGAVVAYEELHTDCLRVLGPDHPHTLLVRGGLAIWRDRAGGPVDPVEFEQLVADFVRVYGPEHLETLAIRANLADLRGRAGDPRAAAATYQKLITDYRRALGPDHPLTLISRDNLANWLGEAGDADAAVAEYELLLTDRLRVLGGDHPATLTTRANLANWQGKAGDPRRASIGYQELVADLERISGPDNIATLNGRYNLIGWQGQTYGPELAIAANEKLLADILRVFGPDWFGALRIRNDLAYWRGLAGDSRTAVIEYEQLLADCVRILGPDHPFVRAVEVNLTYLRTPTERSEP